MRPNGQRRGSARSPDPPYWFLLPRSLWELARVYDRLYRSIDYSLAAGPGSEGLASDPATQKGLPLRGERVEPRTLLNAVNHRRRSGLRGLADKQSVLNQKVEVEIPLGGKLDRIALLPDAGEGIEQPSLQLAVAAVKDSQILLVDQHRLAVDIALGRACMIGWAEGDQVLEGVRLDLRPRLDVMKLYRDRATGRNRATMTRLDQHAPFKFSRNPRSPLCHREDRMA
jgi:hypothetical protein